MRRSAEEHPSRVMAEIVHLLSVSEDKVLQLSRKKRQAMYRTMLEKYAEIKDIRELPQEYEPYVRYYDLYIAEKE